MNRLLVLSIAATVLLGAAVAWAGSGQREKRSRPNVVLLIIDTLRADKLSAYGYPLHTSPELDILAHEGVRFARDISQSSWTRPSIGSMLTSRYPRELGLYKERWDMLPKRFETLAEVLAAHGYRTIGATANPNINSVFGFRQGFDRYFDSNVVFRWMRAKSPGAVMYRRHLLKLAPEIFGALDRELDGESATERKRPHFLQADLMEVHESYRFRRIVRPEYRGLFLGRPPMERHYLQAIRQVSADVGRFIDGLRRRPGWHDALFVITSDHGQGLRSHPHVPNSTGHGWYLYGAEVHVPLILYSPDRSRLPAARVVQRHVRGLDVMPTVLDLLHIASPASVRGTSLVPLIRDPRQDDVPDVFFTETEFRHAHKVAAYSPAWAYIENRERRSRRKAELQPVGARNDGALTDQRIRHPIQAAHLAHALGRWEAEFPPAAPKWPPTKLDASTKAQLRALGYAR